MVKGRIHGKSPLLPNGGRDAAGRNLLASDCECDPRWSRATARLSLPKEGKTGEANQSEPDPLCGRFLHHRSLERASRTRGEASCGAVPLGTGATTLI